MNVGISDIESGRLPQLDFEPRNDVNIKISQWLIANG